MADRLIASDLSYECLQRRRGLGELTPPVLDEAHRRRHGVRDYRAFLPIEDGSDNAVPNPPRIAVGEREE